MKDVMVKIMSTRVSRVVTCDSLDNRNYLPLIGLKIRAFTIQ